MKIVSLLLLLFISASAYDYEKAYNAANFITMVNSYESALQGSQIIIENKSTYFSNPAMNTIDKKTVSYSSNRFFSGFFTHNIATFSSPYDSVSSFGAAVSILDIGTWYDTRYLPVDARYDIEGNATGDSTGYWDDDAVIKRSAYDVLGTVVYGRDMKHFGVGGRLNILYQNYDVYSNFGSSLDASIYYRNKTGNIKSTLVLKNIGGSLIADFDAHELNYQYMYVQAGISYRKIIRNRKDTYLDFALSHNALFSDNSDITAAALLKIKGFFEIYGSYSLHAFFSDKYYNYTRSEEYSKTGVGAALDLKFIKISYSQLMDNYSLISNNISFIAEF